VKWKPRIKIVHRLATYSFSRNIEGGRSASILPPLAGHKYRPRRREAHGGYVLSAARTCQRTRKCRHQVGLLRLHLCRAGHHDGIAQEQQNPVNGKPVRDNACDCNDLRPACRSSSTIRGPHLRRNARQNTRCGTGACDCRPAGSVSITSEPDRRGHKEHDDRTMPIKRVIRRGQRIKHREQLARKCSANLARG